jgi:outer membrane immunogenic protein
MDVERNISTTTTRTDTIVTTTGGTTFTTVVGPNLVPSQSVSMSQERTNDFVVGWTAGLGTEYCLWNNVFIRAEWEYIKFVSVMDTNITMNSAHVGLGYKF